MKSVGIFKKFEDGMAIGLMLGIIVGIVIGHIVVLYAVTLPIGQ